MYRNNSIEDFFHRNSSEEDCFLKGLCLLGAVRQTVQKLSVVNMQNLLALCMELCVDNLWPGHCGTHMFFKSQDKICFLPLDNVFVSALLQ